MAAFFRFVVALILGLILLLSILLIAEPSRAQGLQCDAVDRILSYLTDQFGEELVGDGEGPGGTRLLLFAHPDVDTWTVVGVMPGDKACLIASGTNWTAREPTPAGSET